MSKQVFLVTGHTGEYSDSRDWTVCAYRDEHHAAEHAKAAQDWAHAHAAEWLRQWESGSLTLRNPFDPSCDIDYYTGTHYSVEAVEIRDAFDRSAATGQ